MHQMPSQIVRHTSRRNAPLLKPDESRFFWMLHAWSAYTRGAPTAAGAQTA
jgi:hypothetical protein